MRVKGEKNKQRYIQKLEEHLDYYLGIKKGDFLCHGTPKHLGIFTDLIKYRPKIFMFLGLTGLGHETHLGWVNHLKTLKGAKEYYYEIIGIDMLDGIHRHMDTIDMSLHTLYNCSDLKDKIYIEKMLKSHDVKIADLTMSSSRYYLGSGDLRLDKMLLLTWFMNRGISKFKG